MLPKTVNFPLTYECNSRCRMCRVWDRKDSSNELTALQFEKYLFSVPLYNENVEMISFTGGEFCLKEDALQIIDKAFHYTKKLNQVSFISNGLAEKKLTPLIEEISKLRSGQSVKKSIFISIDGIGKPHDVNRGIPGGYERSKRTLQRIIEINRRDRTFNAGILATIGPDNLDQVSALIAKAKELEIDISFQYYRDDAYFCNEPEKLYEFTEEQRQELVKTFKYIFKKLGRESSLTAIDGLSLRKRKQKCFHIENGFLLTPKGDVFPCGMLENRMFLAGNIVNGGFDSAWRKKTSKEFITRMNKQKCSSCPIALGSANYRKSLRHYVKRMQAKLLWP